ncbi:hypothetical protein THRCLA_22375 [Thraustotheca clavata]|uniref:Uncharacterized protein n=1 Tax=Thraustotheca clavata TaxID=74557 RepID=A0A1V9Z3L9_9STRA|nr:hypothetical protein THRCLA_22375 [Thraustotheca clavata]
MDERPWWRQERRHVPAPPSYNNELVERRHLLPIVHPPIDHFANIKPRIRLPPKEPRKEGVKRVTMPLVREERPQGIRINANTYVPENPPSRHKMTSPHKIRLLQQERDSESRLDSWVGSKQHREYIDERNQLPQHSNLGDKSYKRVDNSSAFFNLKLHPKFNGNNQENRTTTSATPTSCSSPVSYEIKKKLQMLHLEQEGVVQLSTSKAGQLSWEDTTGHRTWNSTRKEIDRRDEDE